MSMDKERNILEQIRSRQPDYPDPEFFGKMAENVIAEHSGPFTRISFYKKPVVRWATAAAVMIPFVFFFARNQEQDLHVNPLAELDVPQESIREYVEAEENVLIALKVENSGENSTVIKTVSQLTSEINTETINEYLLEEYGEWENIEETYLYY